MGREIWTSFTNVVELDVSQRADGPLARILSAMRYDDLPHAETVQLRPPEIPVEKFKEHLSLLELLKARKVGTVSVADGVDPRFLQHPFIRARCACNGCKTHKNYDLPRGTDYFACS